MVGGTLLLLSGLAMGFINTYLFRMGWFVTSLVLFLVALGFGRLYYLPYQSPSKPY
jgi:uncharacterized membrane protein